jgi:hypothetical protein
VPSLFHAVPNEMVGSVLYPLSELEQVNPQAWGREREKYTGREHVLDVRVPPARLPLERRPPLEHRAPG